MIDQLYLTTDIDWNLKARYGVVSAFTEFKIVPFVELKQLFIQLAVFK